MTILGNFLYLVFQTLQIISGLNFSDFKSLIKTVPCCVACRKHDNGCSVDRRAPAFPADLYCFLVSSCSPPESTCFVFCHAFGFSTFPDRDYLHVVFIWHGIEQSLTPWQVIFADEHVMRA